MGRAYRAVASLFSIVFRPRERDLSMRQHVLRGLILISLPMDVLKVLQSGPAPLSWKLALGAIFLIPASVAGVFFGLMAHWIARTVREWRTPE
jgi:hypothetical protein